MGTNIRRLIQLFKFGRKDAEAVSRMPEVNLSKSAVFKDMVKCFFKYNIRSLTYKKEGVWKLSPEQREELGKKCQLEEEWLQDFYENHRFLIKWSSLKYEASAKLQLKRNDAYRRKYNMGKKCFVGHDVLIERHHYLWGTIKIGNNCLLAKHTYIDYSGELVLEDNVKLSDGVVIETHRHEFVPGLKESKAIPTKIVIETGAWVGQKASICDEVKRIGRYAQIGAGAIVRNPIPPYALVVGNPAKIVGFLYTPEEVAEFEKDSFPEAERIDIEKYTKLYEKYFIDRMSEIKKLLNN